MNYANGPEVKDLVALALREDIAKGDITSEMVIPQNKSLKAALLAKEPCAVSGLGIAALVFKTLDRDIRFKAEVKEGAFVKKGKVVARIFGRTKSILAAERVALNFLSHLSGISTATRAFTQAVKPYKVKIIDTRKTIPGLRLLQKYAVRLGGGFNHRFSLDEMVMIKDNHLQVIGGIDKLKSLSRKYKIEIEVKSLKEFKLALAWQPDIIMLDNMPVKSMKKAVKIRNNLAPNTQHLTPKLEASGGITLKNVKKVAATGVDFISIGALTHSVKSCDISLEIL